MNIKICSICEVEKSLDDFYRASANRDGYRNDCKECCKKRDLKRDKKVRCEKQKTYYREHREARLAYNKQYYEANREELMEKMREWASNNFEIRQAWEQENRDKRRAQEKARWEANPEHFREKCRRRKAQLRNNTPDEIMLTLEEWEDVKKSSNGLCYYCGNEMNMKTSHTPQSCTQDHVKPLSKGGFHTRDNVVAACQSCNSVKGNKI